MTAAIRHSPRKEVAKQMTRPRKSQKTARKKVHKELDHSKQLPRLRRIEGQVRGLQSMIENKRDCIDIVHQISAIIAALRRVQGDMLSEHVAACAESAITGATSASNARKVADEIGRIVTRLV